MKKSIVLIASILALSIVFVINTALVSIQKTATQVEAKSQMVEPTFEEFLALFPKADLPLSLDLAAHKKRLNTPSSSLKTNTIPRKYHRYLHGLESSAFSRMPMVEEPIFAFQNADYQGVVVAQISHFSYYFPDYSLIVFKNDGTYWGTHDFGAIRKAELTTADLDTTLQLTLTSYKILRKSAETAGQGKLPEIKGFEELATVIVDCKMARPVKSPNDMFLIPEKEKKTEKEGEPQKARAK